MKRMKFLDRCLGIICLILLVGGMSGCVGAGQGHGHASEKPLVPTDHGTVILDGLYEFEAPEGYRMFRDLGDGETVFMFFKMEEGEFPSQTSFFYNEKVYGNSLDLETRVDQFVTLFLAGRGIRMEVINTEDGMIDGRHALVVHTEGDNPYRNEKALSVGYFFKLGQYIVSLACTQWRPMDGEFDPKIFQEFETFAKSFKYVQKPFYEEIDERIKSLKN